MGEVRRGRARTGRRVRARRWGKRALPRSGGTGGAGRPAPGGGALRAAADRRANGVPVNDGTMVELLDLCNYLKLDFASYFPGYAPPAFTGFAGNY